MKKLDELKPQLEHGDNRRISELSKVQKPTVDAILSGAINSNTPTGEKILRAAAKLIDSRKHLLEGSSDEEPKLQFSKGVA